MLYKNNLASNLVLFLIWPFAAFLYALKNFHQKSGRIIIYLFILLFGFTFVLGNEKLDSFRYAEYFQNMSKFTFSDLQYFFNNLFSTEQTLDFGQPLITFLVSRFSDDHRVFFGVIAGIFGFFYLKSVSFLYNKHYYYNKNIYLLFFILYFALIINPIFNINGFRFWTATWIFFYGAYLFINTKEKKFFVITMISIFFHFSYIAPIAIFFFYLVLGNRNKLYLVLLVASFFISDIVFQFIPQAANILGEGVMERVGRYANLDTMKNVAENAELAKEEGKWYLFLPGKFTFYYITFVFLYLWYKFKKKINEVPVINTFSFSLLLLSFANTVSFIPSMGRFRTLFLLFGLAVIVAILKNVNSREIKWLFYIGVIPFTLNLITVIRLGIDITNPWLFTLLPFPFLISDQSIYQLIF